jgi:hypothetical protein
MIILYKEVVINQKTHLAFARKDEKPLFAFFPIKSVESKYDFLAGLVEGISLAGNCVENFEEVE